MKFTGKQFIPGQTSKRIEQDHLECYKFAVRFIKGKNVLDIACGVGYGSKILKDNGALSVDGVDVSEEAINFAKKHYSMGGVNFFLSDAVAYHPSRRYDVIISFETIQYINDFRAIIKNFHDWLNKGGILLVSASNRIITSPSSKTMADKPAEKTYLREFTIDELTQELQKSGFILENDYLFGQRQQRYFKNPYLRRLYKILFKPDFKSSPTVEPLKRNKQSRYFLLKAVK